MFFFFFFSSRRRHTRFDCDWSSDVCSSDLLNIGQSRWEAVLEAAREVAMPIFASTVTTVVVFLPIFFLVGIAKLLFIPLVFTITIALFTSFFVSRTVTPALCYKFVKPEREAQRSLPDW